jgi:FkbM family methyltransferase
VIRQIGTITAASIEKVIGRRHLVRASRLLLDYARRDMPNRMATNGEWMVQDIVLASAESDCLVAIDVGANIGEWSRRFLTTARERGRRVQVHAFEPAAATFDALVANLLPTFERSLVPVRCAASDHSGKGTLFKVHELAGSNSIHGIAGSTQWMESEAIELCTLDEYCSSAGLETIDILKIDAEGHDALVLGAIQVVQFEYNHRWIGARRYLKDIFDDVAPLGYEVGKVTARSIEWYSRWSPELETFREGNYLAARTDLRRRFPSMRWWLDA